MSAAGEAEPSAVLTLMTNSNLLALHTAGHPGLAPFRIRST